MDKVILINTLLNILIDKVQYLDYKKKVFNGDVIATMAAFYGRDLRQTVIIKLHMKIQCYYSYKTFYQRNLMLKETAILDYFIFVTC